MFWFESRMMLCIVEYSRPDIANATHKLLKVMIGTHQAAFLKMNEADEYVLDTRNLVLKIEPNMKEKELWHIICFSKSDYSGDPVTRKSISEYILDALGAQVSWQSKAYKNMTQSHSETEWVALLETVKDLMHVVCLLQSMMILIKLLVMVRVDNMGAIFMAGIITVASHTKHMDIR